MDLNTIAAALSQSVANNTVVTGFCTDSRSLKPGNVFIALTGEHFDGHAYVRDVEAKGAAAVVVSRATPGVRIPQFIVPDPLQGLADIAAVHRQNMSCPVIALTGSNGKTTVKEMIAACLPYPSHATKGNLNNHIGAPLSILEWTTDHRYAVFELGASHSGEIRYTASLVRPAVTLINNIAPAHVEGFGSLDGVARAKGEIHQCLTAGGTAVINNDDHYAHFWDAFLTEINTIRFSSMQDADVYAKEIRFDTHGRGLFTLVLPNGQADIALQVPGKHNIQNALAAASCAYAVGISLHAIQAGLNNFTGVQGRMTVLPGKNKSTVIDDSYNANLQSVLSALDILAQRPGTKIFAFGDMAELGSFSREHHEEVGIAARQLGIDRVLTCGVQSQLASQAFGDGGVHFTDQESLVENILEELSSNTTVLVKGSRSSKMEQIVHKLLN